MQIVAEIYQIQVHTILQVAEFLCLFPLIPNIHFDKPMKMVTNCFT